MSNDAWIGDKCNNLDGVCSYAPDPSVAACGAPATVHVMAESAIYGLVGLSACNRHLDVARESGPVHGEHPFGPHCCGFRVCWRDDGCIPLLE